MEIVVVVHRITHEPENVGLWRWAVHVGRDFSDKDSCLNAGAEEEQAVAEMRGQAVGVAAAKVAQRCGVLELFDDRPTTVVLVNDPCREPWPLTKVEEY